MLNSLAILALGDRSRACETVAGNPVSVAWKQTLMRRACTQLVPVWSDPSQAEIALQLGGSRRHAWHRKSRWTLGFLLVWERWKKL